MPIKFRCNYCRQFLGISRAQAGGIVDCPTCGRSIRVPLLDGTLQPLPTPELNVQDSHLARALDELARLANVSEPQPDEYSREQEQFAEDEGENEIPQPIPEPIPIEVPIPPTPIAVQASYHDDEAVQTLSSSNVEPGSANMGRQHSILAELASLPPVPVAPGAEAPPAPKYSASAGYPVRSLPRISIMIVLSFVVGMLFERFVKVLESVRPSTHTVSTEKPAAAVDATKQVTGRITFQSADGSSQPDRGARIIAFPQQREGEVKLSVVGFRPSDVEADAKVAVATLHALGGALATADEAGQYRLEIPAGNYQLLVLSHFQQRGDKEPVDPTTIKALAAYFEKPEDLLGRIKHYFGPLKVKGTGDVWDHTF